MFLGWYEPVQPGQPSVAGEDHIMVVTKVAEGLEVWTSGSQQQQVNIASRVRRRTPFTFDDAN
jgi:hypothetical protein